LETRLATSMELEPRVMLLVLLAMKLSLKTPHCPGANLSTAGA